MDAHCKSDLLGNFKVRQQIYTLTEESKSDSPDCHILDASPLIHIYIYIYIQKKNQETSYPGNQMTKILEPYKLNTYDNNCLNICNVHHQWVNMFA